LHSSPAGQRLGRADGDLPVTDDAAARLVRLPLWPGLEPEDQLRVVDALVEAVSECPAHA
jgi:dTDP-4-amino-4,6-dideoxygalactose transaminase